MINILFVDDDMNILMGYKRTLYSMKDEWKLYTAGSAQHGLQLLQSEHIDIVVTDMRMPVMDGAQLLSVVKNKYPNVVRLILSGFTDREAAMKVSGLAHQVLAKPTNADALKTWGWWLFGTIWGVAIVGIVFHKFISRQKPIIRSMAFVIMGCGIIAGIKPLLANVAPGGLILLFAGGLAYIGGSVIYAAKKIPYNHAIWHLFVLAGTVCHFFAILFYVVPLAEKL